MKKKILIIALALAATLALASCGLIKGGTIEVTNNYKPLGLEAQITVTIYKGLTLLSATKMDQATLAFGETKKFTYEEDGTYLVQVPLPLSFTAGKSVSLSGGKTEKVTVE